MPYNFTEGSGRIHASDLVGGEDVSRQKMTFGGLDTAVLVDIGTPMPASEPPKGDPLAVGAVAGSPATSQQVAAQNLNRRVLEISNANTYGVWVRFGSGSAVAGQGSYLPSKATGYWPTTARAAVIVEALATGVVGGLIGYTEW